MTDRTPLSWHSHIYFDADSHPRAEALVEGMRQAFGETCALCSCKMLSWSTNFYGESCCTRHIKEHPACQGCSRLVVLSDVATRGSSVGIRTSSSTVTTRVACAT